MRFYEFADFRLNPQERVLYRGGQPVQLAPKVFDTLLALVSRHGQLVTKEALIEEIWGDTFVEENNLTQYIFTLRRILGEKKDGAKFIETVPRRGYRFTAEVRVQEVSNVENGTELKKEIHISTPPILETPTKLSTEKVTAEKFSSPKDRFKRLVAFGFVVLLIAISLGFAVRYEWRQSSLASNSRELKFKRLTEKGNLFGVAISPDGNSLAYVAVEGKNHSVRLRNIATESELVIVPPEGIITSPCFSPDGNFIYYAQSINGDSGTIYQIPVLGGERRQIAKNLWSGFSVSPDGREIAFPRKDASAKKHYIVVAATDGSGERIVGERIEPDYFALWGPAPAWLPDGAHLTVAVGSVGVEGNHLVQLNLNDGSEREIKTEGEWNYIESIAWAGRNELIIAAQEKTEEKSQLWRITFPGGKVERLTNDFSAYVGFSLTKDASRLVALKHVENIHLWHFDRETSVARQLTSGENRVDGFSGLAFAPDGQIIFSARNKNEYDIFSINADGSDLRQLTKNASRRNFDPVVSPDNRLIVFVSKRTGADRLWIMNRDGSEPRQLTPPSDDKQTGEVIPYFSPDGKWIYYTLFRNTSASIYKISIDGGEPVQVSPPGKERFTPVVSPDGNSFAFASHDPEAKRAWSIGVQSLADGKERFFDFPAFRQLARWMPDSQSLVTMEHNFHGANLWQTNLETGERRQITNFTAERLYRFDVSRDGRFFAVARGNGFYDAVLIER